MKQDFASLEINDLDLIPVYRPGDVALYVEARGVDPALDGCEAVVATSDGRRLLRVIRRDGEKRWTLETPDGQQERGVRLRSAAAVKWIRRGSGRGPTLH